jgi:hypothetical protein
MTEWLQNLYKALNEQPESGFAKTFLGGDKYCGVWTVLSSRRNTDHVAVLPLPRGQGAVDLLRLAVDLPNACSAGSLARRWRQGRKRTVRGALGRV